MPRVQGSVKEARSMGRIWSRCSRESVTPSKESCSFMVKGWAFARWGRGRRREWPGPDPRSVPGSGSGPPAPRRRQRRDELRIVDPLRAPQAEDGVSSGPQRCLNLTALSLEHRGDPPPEPAVTVRAHLVLGHEREPEGTARAGALCPGEPDP